jgi:hypothetical protein
LALASLREGYRKNYINFQKKYFLKLFSLILLNILSPIIFYYVFVFAIIWVEDKLLQFFISILCLLSWVFLSGLSLIYWQYLYAWSDMSTIVICPSCLRSIITGKISVQCPFCDSAIHNHYIFTRCSACNRPLPFLECPDCQHPIDLFAEYNRNALEKKTYAKA